MIDLARHHEAQIARQCANDANRIQSLHSALETLMQAGDDEAACCYASQIALVAEKIARSASYLATRGPE